MIETPAISHPPTHCAGTTELALPLAKAENELRTLTSGQLDGIIDREGKTYLLHPAQEHLRQNESRLQAVIESAADGIMVIDRGGKIISQSRAALRMLGREREPRVGESLFKFIHLDDLFRVYCAFFNVIEEFSAAATVEFRHRQWDGSYRTLEATFSKLRGASPASVVLICRDLRWRREAQAEAARREAELIAALQVKVSFLAMLSRELREDEHFAEARAVTEGIRRNVELQSRLLEELMDFTKVGHHKVRLQMESLDVHEAVRTE
jgi:PAS domain S-box-containing protein